MKTKTKKYRTKKREINKKKNLILFFSVLVGVSSVLVAFQGVNTELVLINDLYAKTPKTAKSEQIKATDMTIADHVWEIMTDEYDLSLNEKVTAMRIVDCESRFYPYAINKNTDGSYDLGIWQINEKFHDITRECAFDVYCSTRYAMSIYQSWESFEAWVCY